MNLPCDFPGYVCLACAVGLLAAVWFGLRSDQGGWP